MYHHTKHPVCKNDPMNRSRWERQAKAYDRAIGTWASTPRHSAAEREAERALERTDARLAAAARALRGESENLPESCPIHTSTVPTFPDLE